MTTTALVTMLIAWTVILFFMLRFLVKVLRTPMKKGTDEGARDDVSQ